MSYCFCRSQELFGYHLSGLL